MSTWCAIIRAYKLEDRFRRFTVAKLHRVDETLADAGIDHETVNQHVDGSSKIDIEQRLGCRELKYPPVLVEPVEATLAKRVQPGLEWIWCYFVMCFGA